MKSHTTRRSFYVLGLRCSRGPPSSGCRRWSLTGGRMRSWRQKCLRRPRRRFLSSQGCFLWGPKAEHNNTVSDFTSKTYNVTSLLKTAVGGKNVLCSSMLTFWSDEWAHISRRCRTFPPLWFYREGSWRTGFGSPLEVNVSGANRKTIKKVKTLKRDRFEKKYIDKHKQHFRNQCHT